MAKKNGTGYPHGAKAQTGYVMPTKYPSGAALISSGYDFWEQRITKGNPNGGRPADRAPGSSEKRRQ